MNTKKTAENIIRQGDVILIPVADMKFSAKEEIPAEQGRCILAHGEVTGHAHALPMQTSKRFQKDGKQFVQVKTPSMLRHEEHAPIELNGTYEMRIAREYTPAGVKKVVD